MIKFLKTVIGKLLPSRLPFGAKFNRALRYFLRLIVYLFVGTMLLATIAFFYLLVEVDKNIAPKFKNVHWSLPARVYARPLELYVGYKTSISQIQAELELSKYRQLDRLEKPGSYRIHDNTISIFTREFIYSDGVEKEKRIIITIDKETVSSLRTMSVGQDEQDQLDLVRIEPVEIASIYPQHNEDRILLKYEDIPPALIDTLTTMEDRAFFNHIGINIKAIIRAMIINLKSGKNTQGGSTLTQQLVKNYFLTNEKSFSRKIKEALYSLVIDYRYPKSSILEAYMNEIYLGQSGSQAIHGFGLASWFYFGKPINELGLHEIALLVGIVPAPTSYNPRRFPDLALQRRNLVLDVIHSRNLISKTDAETLKKLPLGIIEQSVGKKYPAFMDLVNQHLKTLYTKDDLSTEGLKIFTTLDPITQQKAEESIQKMLPQLEKVGRQKPNMLQGALIVVKTQTSELEAIVGDRDVQRFGFNRALNARRQIGSLIKPIIYLRALEEPKRYSLATHINGSSIQKGEFGKWQPKNYNRRLEHASVPLITSLAKSYNIPTVRLGMDLGVNEVIKTLYRLGLSPEKYQFPEYPSLLLGALEITPLDVAQIYSTIANGGYRTPIVVIREVTTADGKILAQTPTEAVQAVYEDRNYLITRAMQEVVYSGTAARLKSKIKTPGIAGKTGTTNENVDSWFAGFSGDRVAVSWLGRDDNKNTGLTGSTGGLVLWMDFMSKLNLQPVEPKTPSSIVFRKVDMATGFLPDEYGACGKVMTLPFIKNFQPKESAECWFSDEYIEN